MVNKPHLEPGPIARPTTGRRHLRAGSVHVTELIKKQPPLLDVPKNAEKTSHGEQGDGALDGLLDPAPSRPSSHRKPPSKAAQAAKLAGLGVASFVLCAAVAFASMITHERRDGTQTQAAERPVMEITGERALLPDVLNRAIPLSTESPAPSLPAAGGNASGSIDNQVPPALPQPPAPAPADTRNGPHREGVEPISNKQLVEEFYRLVLTWPDKAFDLLAADLLGTDLGEFVQSWATVSTVAVLDVRDRGDDVVAVVRMTLPDGSHLRLQQLLTVADTAPRRIIGAEILSAQRY